jgi:hypothetical protein
MAKQQIRFILATIEGSRGEFKPYGAVLGEEAQVVQRGAGGWCLRPWFCGLKAASTPIPRPEGHAPE